MPKYAFMDVEAGKNWYLEVTVIIGALQTGPTCHYTDPRAFIFST